MASNNLDQDTDLDPFYLGRAITESIADCGHHITPGDECCNTHSGEILCAACTKEYIELVIFLNQLQKMAYNQIGGLYFN